jgi:membrane fusion protein, multidrug efflux system
LRYLEEAEAVRRQQCRFYFGGWLKAMRKKILVLAVLALVAVVAVLGGIKGLQIDRMIAHGKQMVPPPEAVTTATATLQSWESLITAVGSLSAVQGVIVSAELTGKVSQIAFTAGASVKAGELLVRQDTSSEEAQLRSAEAAAALARLNLDRLSKLLGEKTISQSQFDNSEAAYKQAVAQADTMRAAIAKKTIRAPFSGRLGIRQINLGQVIKEGQSIVSLQALDPIFVDFSLPQQNLPQLKPGLAVRVTTDALPGEVVQGRITAINPQVEAATRTISVQATVANPDERLRPGMYVNVAVVMPSARQVLAIPAPAVLYAPYSDSVFVVEERPDPAGGPSALTVRQQFAKLGERQGDFVAVLSGLKAGDTVVSTGVFKLRNGQAVTVQNALSPEFKLHPKPSEE